MNRPRPDLYRLVHSTDRGRLCPDCGATVDRCRCTAERGAAKVFPDGFARVRLEKQGRGGKTVTAIDGLARDGKALPAAEVTELAKALKKKAGSGGTVKDGRIELQGDHAAMVMAELEKRGLKAKRAGGGA